MILFSLRSTGANLLNDQTTCLGDDNLCDLFRPSCLPVIAHADEISILPFAYLLDQPTGIHTQAKRAEYRERGEQKCFFSPVNSRIQSQGMTRYDEYLDH